MKSLGSTFLQSCSPSLRLLRSSATCCGRAFSSDQSSSSSGQGRVPLSDLLQDEKFQNRLKGDENRKWAGLSQELATNDPFEPYEETDKYNELTERGWSKAWQKYRRQRKEDNKRLPVEERKFIAENTRKQFSLTFATKQHPDCNPKSAISRIKRQRRERLAKAKEDAITLAKQPRRHRIAIERLQLKVGFTFLDKEGLRRMEGLYSQKLSDKKDPVKCLREWKKEVRLWTQRQARARSQPQLSASNMSSLQSKPLPSVQAERQQQLEMRLDEIRTSMQDAESFEEYQNLIELQKAALVDFHEAMGEPEKAREFWVAVDASEISFPLEQKDLRGLTPETHEALKAELADLPEASQQLNEMLQLQAKLDSDRVITQALEARKFAIDANDLRQVQQFVAKWVPDAQIPEESDIDGHLMALLAAIKEHYIDVMAVKGLPRAFPVECFDACARFVPVDHVNHWIRQVEEIKAEQKKLAELSAPGAWPGEEPQQSPFDVSPLQEKLNRLESLAYQMDVHQDTVTDEDLAEGQELLRSAKEMIVQQGCSDKAASLQAKRLFHVLGPLFQGGRTPQLAEDIHPLDYQGNLSKLTKEEWMKEKSEEFDKDFELENYGKGLGEWRSPDSFEVRDRENFLKEWHGISDDEDAGSEDSDSEADDEVHEFEDKEQLEQDLDSLLFGGEGMKRLPRFPGSSPQLMTEVHPHRNMLHLYRLRAVKEYRERMARRTQWREKFQPGTNIMKRPILLKKNIPNEKFIRKELKFIRRELAKTSWDTASQEQFLDQASKILPETFPDEFGEEAEQVEEYYSKLR